MPWNMFWTLLLQAAIVLVVLGAPIALFYAAVKAALPKEQGPAGPQGPMGPPGPVGMPVYPYTSPNISGPWSVN